MVCWLCVNKLFPWTLVFFFNLQSKGKTEKLLQDLLLSDNIASTSLLTFYLTKQFGWFHGFNWPISLYFFCKIIVVSCHFLSDLIFLYMFFSLNKFLFCFTSNLATVTSMARHLFFFFHPYFTVHAVLNNINPRVPFLLKI